MAVDRTRWETSPIARHINVIVERPAMKSSPRPGALPMVATLVITGCLASGDQPPVRPSPHHHHVQHGSTPVGPITVSAATSLAETFTVLGKEFEAAYPGTEIIFHFGASSALAPQVVTATPPDVFVADDPAALTWVTAAGGVEGAPTVLARNRLVVAVARTNPAHVAGIADLARPRMRVALCAAWMPCGAAAKRAFDAAGVTVAPTAVEKDGTAAITRVERGEADAALVYYTAARAASSTVDIIDIAPATQTVADCSVVAVRNAANPTGAAAFIGFITSALARRVLTEAGFGVP